MNGRGRPSLCAECPLAVRARKAARTTGKELSLPLIESPHLSDGRELYGSYASAFLGAFRLVLIHPPNVESGRIPTNIAICDQ